MHKRELSLARLCNDAESKTLQVCIGGKNFDVGFRRIEIEGLGQQWIVSREDLDCIFGCTLKPYYAPLLAELANQKLVALKLSLDLDELDKRVAAGYSFKDAIPKLNVDI